MNSEENKKIRKHFRTKRNEEKKEEYSQQQQKKFRLLWWMENKDMKIYKLWKLNKKRNWRKNTISK